MMHEWGNLAKDKNGRPKYKKRANCRGCDTLFIQTNGNKKYCPKCDTIKTKN